MSVTDFVPEPLRGVGRRLLAAAGLLEVFRSLRTKLELELFNRQQNRLTEEQISGIYKRQYHVDADYGLTHSGGSGWKPDSAIKDAHARAVMGTLPGIRKVLVGGCSSGMAVAAFRRLGVDAWGFDISPDLEEIVMPEVRDFVCRGSMLAMPFGPADGFDCLVTTDVLEHVQLKNIERMTDEIGRLDCRWMAHIINHTSMQPDHMTLKPLSWWAVRLSRYYVLRSDLRAPESGDPGIYGLNGDPLHIFTFWERRRKE